MKMQTTVYAAVGGSGEETLCSVGDSGQSKDLLIRLRAAKV